ncbi:MAG: hypothetical protein H7301_09460 [Cryobacterium sp.]|nr:hypothetical protein [Oligoflexia bacterium]
MLKLAGRTFLVFFATLALLHSQSGFSGEFCIDGAQSEQIILAARDGGARDGGGGVSQPVHLSGFECQSDDRGHDGSYSKVTLGEPIGLSESSLALTMLPGGLHPPGTVLRSIRKVTVACDMVCTGVFPTVHCVSPDGASEVTSESEFSELQKPAGVLVTIRSKTLTLPALDWLGEQDGDFRVKKFYYDAGKCRVLSP